MVDKYMVHLDADGKPNCMKCGADLTRNGTLSVVDIKKWKAFSNVAKPNEYYRCKYA